MKEILKVTKIYNNKTSMPSIVRNRYHLKNGDEIVWYVNDNEELCMKNARSTKSHSTTFSTY